MINIEYAEHSNRHGDRMESMFHDGKQIGLMRCRTSCSGTSYHAILYAHTHRHAPLSHNGGIAQGEGKTREEAINNALDKNRREAEQYLQNLTVLDQRIRGEKQ